MSEEHHKGYGLNSQPYKRIIFSLFLAGVATFALLYNVQPLLPNLSSSFSITPDQAALSVSAGTFGIAIALLFAGPVSDRLGRRPTILISLYLSALMAVLIPLAPNWTVLLILRVLQGMALAGLPAVAVVYLAEELIPKAQTRAAGVYIGGTAIGGMSGRLIAGFLTDFFGWRTSLLVMGILSALIAVSVHLLLPRQRGFQPSPIKLKQLGQQTGRVLRDPVIICLYGLGAVAAGANIGMFNIIGYHVDDVYHFSAAIISLFYLTYTIGSVTSASSSRLAARFGLRKVLPFPLIIMIVGVALMFTPNLWVLIAGLILANAGYFGAHGIASGWVALRGKALGGITGQAAAGYSFFYYVGSSLFGWIITHMWAFGWFAGLGATMVLPVIGLLLALFLKTTTSLEDRLEDAQ